MTAACREQQASRRFNDSNCIPPWDNRQKYGGHYQERQRCKMAEYAVVQMDNTQREMSVMRYMIDALRTIATYRHLLMKMQRREQQHRQEYR